ncbi:MAG: HAMP domain-containing histidine kinase [Roseburia sp.]|nr:HAMP domain-containing histidine kinase [Roseburia sp.]MCM1242526.1 HAMP domain-containing histidine kinase [Roseburia sp.]
MKKQFAAIIIAFLAVLAALAAGGMLFWEKEIQKSRTQTGNALVLVNEIEQLTMPEEGVHPADEELETLKEELHQLSPEEQIRENRRLFTYYICFAAAFLLFVSAYLYRKILRPFDKLEEYAAQIAKGNLEATLAYERTNFFGAFTWAFDHMRKEILTAKKNEAQAVQENKTIIATLSHDIKTPIASIRAYAEGMEASLAADYETRERYLRVMMKKCDEVSRLVNDLVLHSLSELERLEMKEQRVNIGHLLRETVQDFAHSFVSLQEPLAEAELIADEKRLSQALFNILENAEKYASGSAVDIWTVPDKERYEIHIRDHGEGICPEDMPFVQNKFYRGKNVGDKPGSGLGLYIVDYIMERMHGGMMLENHADGLEVCLWLPSGTVERKEGVSV